MKFFSIVFLLFFIQSSFAESDPAELSAERIRKGIIPYLRIVEKDEAHLVKEKDKIDLSRILFFDKRLSGDSTNSCNSCHDLKNYGTNGEHYKKLIEKGEIFRDVPSIYNLGDFTIFNWDGSHKTLETKTAAALENTYEMNMADSEELVARLQKSEKYIELFKKAFPDKKDAVSKENVVIALSEFQKGLVTIAPIDLFLKGDNKALTEKQLKGAFLFDQKSCFGFEDITMICCYCIDYNSIVLNDIWNVTRFDYCSWLITSYRNCSTFNIKIFLIYNNIYI